MSVHRRIVDGDQQDAMRWDVGLETICEGTDVFLPPKIAHRLIVGQMASE